MKSLFYRFDFDDNNQVKNVLIDAKFSLVLWKPSVSEIVPAGVAWLPFAVWWVMHYLHIFANRDYSLFLIYDSKTIVHRSVITPRYFRFPFMAREDLQIGDTWTMPEYRGKGLATFAIQKIVELHKKPGRRFWYVVEEDNIPSIRAVEKTGFVKYGVGARRKRMGMALFGFFEMQQRFV
jgi:RimJ/RimL family protein N-acetyltransferase